MANIFETKFLALVAMKEGIQCRLSQKDWEKIENSVERLLEQASILSKTYQYHEGLLQIETLFDFLLKFPSIDDVNLKTIEEDMIRMEITFRKRELLERLRRMNVPEEKALLWNVILSPLTEENEGNVENFEHPDPAIRRAVNAARKAMQQTICIFSKYRRDFFLLKVEQAFLALSQSKFERADIKGFTAALTNLNISEKFSHIKNYVDDLEKLKPNPAWPKVIGGLENAIALSSSKSEKITQKRRILRYLSQLIDSFEKYKQFPITTIDALKELVGNRLLLTNSQKIKDKIAEVKRIFEKIEDIYFDTKDKIFLEHLRDECLVLLQKDNVDIKKAIYKFLEENRFIEIRAYSVKFTLVRKDVQWGKVMSSLEEDIKSSCAIVEKSSLAKKDLNECIEKAVTYLESLRVNLMDPEKVKNVSIRQKHVTCIQVIGNLLKFRDSLHGGSHYSELKKELDQISEMLRNDYMAIFLKSDQRIHFLNSIKEISLRLSIRMCKDTDKVKSFKAHLKKIYSAIDERDLNPKSKSSYLFFLKEIGNLLVFQTELLPRKKKDRTLSACKKIIKFLNVIGEMPDDYLTLKFLSVIEEELLPLLSTSKGATKAEINIRKILVPKLSNLRKSKLRRMLLPGEGNNPYIQALVTVIACQLDKNSLKQDRDSGVLSFYSEDLKKRAGTKALIKRLKKQLEAIEKSEYNHKEYSEKSLLIAKTIFSIVDLYTKNDDQKAVIEDMRNIFEFSAQICQFYELDVKVLEKLKQSLLDFSLQKPLSIDSMEKDLKESLIKVICEKYKLTMSVLIQLEEEFLQSQSTLTLEEFSHKVQNKAKEILSFKSKIVQEQDFIKSEIQKVEGKIQKVNLAKKESFEISAILPSLVSRPLNMKDKTYQDIKSRFISLNENKVKLQCIQQRLSLEEKKKELDRVKKSYPEVVVDAEEGSDFFLKIDSRVINKSYDNAKKIGNAIESLIIDIDNIVKEHPFLEGSTCFFVRFRQTDEDKTLAKNFQKFKIELGELKKSTADLSEKMENFGNKMQEMDEAISLFFSETKELSPRRKKTLANFQKILKGGELEPKDNQDCPVSFCTDSQTTKAARRYPIVLSITKLEKEITQLAQENENPEAISIDELREQEHKLAETIAEETDFIRRNSSFQKMREKFCSERSALEEERTQLQSKLVFFPLRNHRYDSQPSQMRYYSRLGFRESEVKI